MPDNVPFSVHNALTKIFTGGTGHHASSDSPKESGEASAPAPPLKPMDPADLRMMLDDGPRAYNDYDERSVFEEIAKLEAVTPPPRLTGGILRSTSPTSTNGSTSVRPRLGRQWTMTPT